MKLIKIIFIFLLSISSIEAYSQFTDTDGDGVLDHLDLDSDNDGIPNCIENGFDGDPNTAFKSNGNATAFTNPPGTAPLNQFRLTNGSSQRGQAWSYGKIDFADSFSITMKVLLSDADGIAMVFQNDPLGISASGILGQGLGARGIVNGIALELDTFQNSCDNDENNGGNCDPSYDHGSIRTTAGTATSGWTKLAGDGQLGDGTVDDGLWHTVVVIWNATTRNLSYTFDGVSVTNYTFPASGANSIESIFGGTTQVRFGFTGSTGFAGSNNSIGFDNPCEIPLYFDTDGDGVPDYLDLDSDNDGCYDSLEGDGTYVNTDLNDDGSINTTIYPIDANGVPNNGNSQGIGQSQNNAIADCDCPGLGTDNDGDGIDDTCDLDNDNDGILDSDECGSTEKITNGVFPTSGGNTNTVPGWTVGGTYASNWPSGTGRVNLNSNGLEFRRDQATITTLSQNLTGVMPGASMFLNDVYWYRTNGVATDQGFTFTISYGGTVYATISSTNSGTPVVTVSNGAWVNIFSLPDTPNNSMSSKEDLIITFPYAGIPSSGQLLFTFTAHASPDMVNDLGFRSVSLLSCKDTDGDGIPDYLDLDSDGDGCPDALEGDENVELSHLNPDGSINTAANGGVDADGVPNLVNSGGTADIGSDQGQGIGDSQNATVSTTCSSSAFCYKPGASGTPLLSSVGITTKGSEPSITDWPESVPNGYLVLDAADKGMVITHMTTQQIDALTPVEGMLVYDTEEQCVKLYRGTAPGVETTRTGWVCIERICISSDDPVDPPAYPEGTGSLAGRMCFDVVEQYIGPECGDLAPRIPQKAEFSQTATNTQTYTFTPTGTVSNVRFVYVNTNGQVIQSITPDADYSGTVSSAATATVVYYNNLNVAATGLSRDQALTGDIYVIYNDASDGSGTDHQLKLTAKVQDCNCCGAYVTATLWKEFLCHNLGADETADPFTPSAAIHGAKYQWGRKDPVLTQAQDQANLGTIAGWNTSPASEGSWQNGVKTVNDPCPVGYRIPTLDELDGLDQHNAYTPIINSPSANSYVNGVMIGNSLFLPFAGSRGASTGSMTVDTLGVVGVFQNTENIGSTNIIPNQFYDNPAFNFQSQYAKTTGLSIRCIAE